MMDDSLPLQPHTHAWLKQSVLETHVAGYWEHLKSRGYAVGTRRTYLCCIAHFAHWMRRKRLSLGRLGEDAVARYLTEHLPRCDCQKPVRRLVHENRAALVHLLVTLRACGAIAQPRKLHAEIEAELERFEQYMRQARGLADNTREQRGAIVRRLLSSQFGSRSVVPARIDAASMRRFIMDHTDRWSAAYLPAHDGHAPAAIWRRHHGDRVVAGPREPIDDAHVPRSRSRHEGARARQTAAADQVGHTLQAARPADAVPAEPLIMCSCRARPQRDLAQK
jgi:hypothetical protein